ncbi:MAG: hypothetical protein IKA02_02250, partial [Clostridia bacterium]|nr:hypothetical protein [Clostridia bacterium]
MKKIISILTILILIVTLSACIKIYIPSQDTDTDTSIPSDENSEITDNLETPLSVTHKTQEMDIYPSYDLGSCYVSEIKKAYINYGNVSYYIFKTYDEANQYTDNGKNLNESIFENNYILVVKFGYTRDKAGLIGFKNLRTGTALNLITVVNDGSGKDTNNEYYYLEIPKENFNGWENFGEIGIRKETIDYANIKEEYPPSDFIMEEDGEILLLSRQELRDFIKDNNLSIIVESLQITDNYIVCYSKKQFGTRLFFTTPTVNGNTVTLYRDYTLSKYKNERAFLHIIPIEAENTVEINKIELTSRVINLDEFYSQGTQIDNTVTTYKNVDFYKTFRGGLYYGTELANRSESSYTVIESYREMLTKTEFCIDEEIFNDNYVLVLKLVGNYEYRLGFANAKASKSETTSIINIDLYLTPYCDEILNDGSEDLKEKVDVIEPTVKTYYEYIVVPKTHLKNVTKTGNLEINVNGTFNNYEEPTVYSYNYNKEMYNIVPGNTWIISSKSEQTQFNQDFGTTFSLNLGKEYGREYVIIYLNEYLNYEILQKAIRETDTLYYLSLLVKPKDTQNTVNKGCFVAFPIDSSSVNKKVIVEFTKINYGEYDSQSVETEIAVYDHYTINLKYNNNPEWTYKVLTDYTKFEEVYNTYKYDPEETLTADAIFSNSIFDTHYVVAFLSYYYDDVYYNARISGDKY